MNILVLGGSGYVGSLVLPAIAQKHALHIYDLTPPGEALAAIPHTVGDVCDAEALARVCAGQDALLYMAMGSSQWQTAEGVQAAFDVNVKGTYLALYAAHQAGLTHAVYTSSMSVYDGGLEARYFPDEEIPPDARHLYGFTKRLGEEVCRNAAREWGLTINALRLCLPTPEDRWLQQTRHGKPTIATAAADVARALTAALEHRFGGFQAFMISGDYEQKIMNMSKAHRLLHWQPLARPVS